MENIFKYLCGIETYVHTIEELYADPEVVRLMSEHASAFFQQHQSLLVEKVFLEIAKLFDPAELGKSKNLSLEYLIEVSQYVNKDDLIDELKLLKARLKTLLILRNKFLCHNDRDFENLNISESLGAIKEVLADVKTLFHKSCGKNFHRFSVNIYPARQLKNWLVLSSARGLPTAQEATVSLPL